MKKLIIFPQSNFLTVAFYFLFVIFIFLSCVTDIDYTEQSTSIPVVNCLLTNDTVQRLSITRSVKMNDSYIFKEIKDALISLYQDEIKAGDFTRISYDNWQLKYTPIAGKTYHIKGILPDGQILTATTVMPERVSIQQNKNTDKFPTKNFNQKSFGSPCWITILNSESILMPYSRPTTIDRAYADIGTDHILVDRFNQEGNLLDFLPTSDTPKFYYYIRIKPDSTTDAILFKLQTAFGFHTSICFRTASMEYDKYLKTSMQKILMRRDETDPGIWFDETKVFSNINNGTGIFAAYYDQYFNYNDDDNYFEN
jgi:hypothetical protein